MEVISVHVPKTAGTTFGKLLSSIYGPERIYMDYNDKPLNPNSVFNIDHSRWQAAAATQVQTIGTDYRVVHGHFPIYKYMNLLKSAKSITWVRHPVSWLVSLYYYWKHTPETDHPLICRLQDEDLSLLEFAEHPLVRNRISQVFLNGLDLADFFFVGIHEHFRDDLWELTHLMGWPNCGVGVENRSPEPGYLALVHQHQSDKRLIDKLQSFNEDDMELYERALRLRTRRLGRARIGWGWRAIGWTVRSKRAPA